MDKRSKNLPSREECYQLFQKYSTPENVINHCETVNHVAVFLASKLKAENVAIDVELVDKASLLHDIARTSEHHAEKGATILRKEGYPQLAAIIKDHRYDTINENKLDSWEKKLVYYADKRVTQSIVSLEERIHIWMEQYPEYAEKIKETLPLVKNLENCIFNQLTISPDELQKELKMFLSTSNRL